MYDLNDILPYIEYTAVATGSISGALHAQRKSFDFIGVIYIGLVSGIGGGLIRDMMLGMGPALVLQSRYILIVAVASSLLGIAFGRLINRINVFIWLVDSLALGLFSVAGLQRAEAFGLSPAPSVFLGIITCVGGGLTRDVLCMDTPRILLSGQPYSIVALFAGIIYMIFLHGFRCTPSIAELLAVCAAFALRLLSLWRKWETPSPPKFTAIQEK